jgi:hypothetical protein
MRVLMVMQHINLFRNLDTVARELDARGHKVVMLHGTRLDDAKVRKKIARKKAKMVFMGRGLEVAQAEVPGVTTGYRPEPDEKWHARLRSGRQVINWSIYLRKGHPSPYRVADALEKRLPPKTQKRLQYRFVRAILGRRICLRVWRWIERLSRPSKTVLGVLDRLRPDVVIVSPTVWPKNPIEADYVRAARARGTPTIGYLNSWDNLTSKGTVHVVPDAYIVWNEALAGEASEIHDIPRKVLRITGAPHLDRVFDMEPTLSHDEVCRTMGCEDARPYLVYLCSSRTLISSEVDIVTGLARALVRELGEGAPTMVVRPHPVNPFPWEDFDEPGVVVYPNHGDQADSPDSWQEYYNQLAHACCFFGLNTTAFLEAVVADRPCLTIVAEEFRAVQGETGHFRHLLAGDFLEVCRDPGEVATRVAQILEGVDQKARGRHSFTESFLRPYGLTKPATTIVADIVEGLGGTSPTRDSRAAEPPRAEPLLTAENDGR